MNDQNENIGKDEKSGNKKMKPLERVTIDDALKEKLTHLTQAANDSLQGMANVNKSDIVNLLIRLHDETLSKAETEELRKIHFSVFKCLTWLQNQAKAAKDSGAEISLNELFEKSREFMISPEDQIQAKRPRKYRKAKLPEIDSIEGSKNDELKV